MLYDRIVRASWLFASFGTKKVTVSYHRQIRFRLYSHCCPDILCVYDASLRPLQTDIAWIPVHLLWNQMCCFSLQCSYFSLGSHLQPRIISVSVYSFTLKHNLVFWGKNKQCLCGLRYKINNKFSSWLNIFQASWKTFKIHMLQAIIKYWFQGLGSEFEKCFFPKPSGAQWG